MSSINPSLGCVELAAHGNTEMVDVGLEEEAGNTFMLE